MCSMMSSHQAVQRRKLLLTMLDAVYVDAQEEKMVVAIKPKPAFRAVFQVATTRKDSAVALIQLDQPLAATDLAHLCLGGDGGESNSPVNTKSGS